MSSTNRPLINAGQGIEYRGRHVVRRRESPGIASRNTGKPDSSDAEAAVRAILAVRSPQSHFQPPHLPERRRASAASVQPQLMEPETWAVEFGSPGPAIRFVRSASMARDL